MALMTRIVGTGLALALTVASVSAQELDPKVIGFKLPDQIKWVDNTRSGNRTAVLQGDPAKPGPEFKPEATAPMPAGSHVIHYAKGVHYDGAKGEQATILVWGEGPATSTPFAPSAPAK